MSAFSLVTMLAVFGSFALITDGKLVMSPEMSAAASSNLAQDYASNEVERGPSNCTRLRREFRTIDGTCNNRDNLGASNTPMSRLSSTAYDDRVDSPRIRSVVRNRPRLPDARRVSRSIHSDRIVNSGSTIMYMQFGQFIDHDFTLGPVPTESGRVITCCGIDNRGVARPLPKECNPLLFREGDPAFDGSCMEVTRTEKAEKDYGRRNRVRQQLNALTSFVDASMVYGSTEEVAESLRAGRRGRLLRSSRNRGEELLPINEEKNCFIENPGDFCFLGGDIRANEQPGLTTMHTMFLRLHNVIANRFRRILPSSATNARIFDQTRKIVGAIVQNILYKEWLPINIGRRTMNRLRLTTGTRSRYDPNVDPSIMNEFATAAFRVGHSMVPSSLPAGNQALRLREHFMRPRVVWNRYNDIAEGLVNASRLVRNVKGIQSLDEIAQARTVDQFVTEELTEHLFEQRPKFAFDLIALNIHRGRDHGLPPYNVVRESCNLTRITGFNDRRFNGTALRRVYRSVNDIDLFSGAMSEPPFQDGTVGETFNCIIGEQFRRLKFGDRHFFETSDQRAGFRFPELRQIRATDMATVMCLTTRIKRVQKDAFTQVTRSNFLLDCNEERSKFLSGLDAFTNRF